jgi:hypothetical protein
MTKRTKVTKPTSAEAPKSEPKFRAKKVADGVITLTDLCRELKHDPKLARAKLRAADPKTFPALAKSHAPRKSWEWEKGSAAIAEARKVLA